MRCILVAVLVVCLVVAAVEVAVTKVACPEDGSRSYFTGETRVNEAGKLMKQYKCSSYGHVFWVRWSK